MRIAQISDPHIRAAKHLYQGLVDSNAMFQAAVNAVNALHPPVDLVLLSGDVVDEGTHEEYVNAGSLLAQLKAPLLAIPGNHDNRQNFRAHFPNPAYADSSPAGPCHFVRDFVLPERDQSLRIVGLDVTVPGAHHGEFDTDAAQWLEKTLSDAPSRHQPTLIMMHQPPLESGIPYIDLYNCRQADRLARLLHRFPNVERILCGHIHRSMQLRFGGTLLCTAPSTTTAIALRLHPDAEEASYVEPPAFLLHHWMDGRILTHWVPVGHFPGPWPFA